MANLEKIEAGGVTYDLRDASAVHTVDSAMSSSSTNPVQNKVVKEYVDDAIQHEPYIEFAYNGVINLVLFRNFTTTPTTYSSLVADADFKIAIARPIVVNLGLLNNPCIQGLIIDMDGIYSSNSWDILFPDAVAFNGTLVNGISGDLEYDDQEGYWFFGNLVPHTPEFKNYTDEAISNLSILSTQVEANATEAATPANGDGLIFADSDDANKLKRMTNGFGTSTTTFLRNDGTWAAPPSSEAPVARIFHGTCSTAAGTTAKVVTCPQFLASDFVTGAIVFVTFTATNSGAVASLTLNVNGTGAKNIKYMRNAAESNLPAVGYLRANMTYRFVYNGTYWVCDTDYDADTVTQLTYRTFRVASDAGGSLYSYKLCALDNNGDLIPFNFVSSSPTTAYTKAITTHLFNPFRGFLYYSGTTTTAAGSGRDANEFKSAIQFDCRYSLNINSSGTAGSTALTTYDPIYVKALYTASTRLAKFVADTSDSNYLVRSSVVQALPSANPNTGLADGTFYIYILLGQVYSKYQINMFDNNTVYYWNTKAGMMTEFTGIIEADYATPADISTAINALDASATGLGVGKTITALSEANGVISASASDIAIDASQITSGTLPTTRLLRPTGENAGTIVSDVTINAQIDNMRANRLAFIPADHIIVERTTDNGATWTAGEYSATDKKHLFAGTRGSRLYIPRINSVRNVNCGLRLTITAMNYNVPEGTTEANWYQYWNSSNIDSAERYTQIKELYFFVNTVNDGLSCKIEAAKGSSSTTWVTLYDSATTTATPFALTGYTGADYVRLVGGPFTFGGGTTQTNNYWNYRITFFTRDADGGTNLSTSSTDVQQYITQICGYGPTSWTNANRLMYNDHLYRWDQDQNATFPAKVTATEFVGDGSNLTSLVSTQIEANATESAAVGTGDGLIFADSDDSNKLKRMTSGFDVSNTTSFLRQDGTWAVPAGGGGGTSGIFKGTCGTGAAGDPKVVQCPEFTSSDLVKGAVIFVTFTYTNSASVNSVQMNVNGTGAKRIMQLKNTVLGTMTTNGELVANQTYMFTYDGTYWVLSNDDDRTNVTALGDGHKNIGTTYRYQFLVSCSKDDTNTTDHKRALFAINAVNSGSTTYTKAFRTWSFDPFGVFAYWNSIDTVSSEGTFVDPTRLQIEGSVSANYAFNVKQNGTVGTQGFVDNKAVYMKSKYDFATQTATLWQNTSSSNYLDRSGLVQELPTTNPNTSTDTYIYIYLGQAFGGDARTFYLLPYHPVYMWNEAKGRMDLFTGGPMEGSGTCTLTDGSNVNITANYYKVGKQVTVSGTIPATSSTASSLSGLPFAAKDSAQLTLSWTDALLTTSVWGRLSVVSGSTNLYTTGYVKIGTTSSHNAGSWLSQVASPGVAFSLTYVTDVP